MAPVFSRSAIRELDQRAIEDYAIPGVVLMENAGRGVSEIARSMADPARPITIFCGAGNNGGDGFVAARHLANAGLDPRVVDVADPECIRGDAQVHREIVRRMGLPMAGFEPEQIGDSLAASGLVLDAIFGTGLDRPIEGNLAALIAQINVAHASGKRVLAVDLPSGLDADSGESLGICIQATRTATFVGHKRGFQNPHAVEHLGVVEVVDIGVPRELARILTD